MREIQTGNSDEIFKNVSALYCALIENRNNMRVKQVTLNSTGEVAAEPFDFLIDVEKVAKKFLTPRQYTLFCVYSLHGKPQALPEDIQIVLGDSWEDADLGVTGPYRTLYFRVKNQTEREKLYGTGDTTDDTTGE